MWILGDTGLWPARTFLGAAPPEAWPGRGYRAARARSCPPPSSASSTSLSSEVVKRHCLCLMVQGIGSRMRDAQILELLDKHGLPAGAVDFVLVPRHGKTSNGTTFGYFFANCASSLVASGLVDVLTREGFECCLARVQGHDVNVARFHQGHRAAQAWVAQGGAWHCITR
jgi:hypothetical protein